MMLLLVLAGLAFSQVAFGQRCQMDIMFVVDVSNTATGIDRQNIRNAIINYAQSSSTYGPIGGVITAENQLRVGVVEFGDTAVVVEPLQTRNSVADLQNALNNQFNVQRGNTRQLSVAFTQARNQLTTSGNRRATGVPIVILILSGNPPLTSERDVRSLVAPFRNEGTLVQVVTYGAVTAQIAQWLASWPASNYLLQAGTSTNIQNTLANNQARLCSQAGGCTNQDLAFILDASGSISSTGFTQIRSFVSRFLRTMQGVRGGDVLNQAGAVRYSTSSQGVSALSSDIAAVATAVDAAPFSDQRTNVAAAFRQVNASVYNPARTNSQKTIVVFTDGWMNEEELNTRPHADSMKSAYNARIVVVALNYDLRLPDINAMASSPLFFNRFLLSSPAELQSNFRRIYNGICPLGAQININPVPTIESRFTGQMDVAFVISNPANMLAADWTSMVNSVADIAATYDLTQTRISVVTVSNTATLNIRFNQFTTGDYRTQVLNAIRTLAQSGQAQNNAESAVELLRLSAFNNVNGDRAAANVAIFVTSEQYSSFGTATFNAGLTQLRTTSQVFSVGVGARVNAAQLNTLGNDPDTEFMITFNNFTEFNSRVQRIAGVTVFNRLTSANNVFTCNFEDGAGVFTMCNMVQDSTNAAAWYRDQFDWTSGTGNTFTVRGTGPQTAFSGANYLAAVSSSARAQFDAATLIFPNNVHTQTARTTYCVRMYVMMNGFSAHIGTLQVFIRRDGYDYAVYSRTGAKGSQWLLMYAEATLFSGDQFGIKAVMRPGIHGDIAIENVNVFRGRCPYDI